MIVSKCPRCHESVRLPVAPDGGSSLPEDARGQCPWCGESFAMTELLNRLPPMLSVTTADGQPIANSVASVSQTDNLETDVPSESPSSDMWDTDEVVDPNDQVAEEAWKADDVRDEIAPMRVASRRRKKKQSAPWKTAAGVLLGGAAALPIADGILILAGRESLLGIWPSLSSTPVASSTRAAAPMDLSTPARQRPQTTDQESTGRPMALPADGDDAMSIDQSAADIISELRPSETSTASDMRTDETGTNETETGDNFDGPDAGGFAATVDESPVDESPVDDPFTMPESDVDVDSADLQTEPAEPTAAVQPEPEAPQPAVSEATAKPSSATRTEQSEEAAPIQMPEIPVVAETTRPDDLTAAIDEANAMVDKALKLIDRPATDSERRAALAFAYQEIAEVGVLAESQSRPAIELLGRIKTSPLLDIYKNASTGWLTHAGRSTDGILIVGKVDDDDVNSTVTVGANSKITIVGGSKLPPNGQVIGLGRIVGDGSDSKVELSVFDPL